MKKEFLVWHKLGGKINSKDILSSFEDDFDASELLQVYIKTSNLSEQSIQTMKEHYIKGKLSRECAYSVNSMIRLKAAIEEENYDLAKAILKFVFV